MALLGKASILSIACGHLATFKNLDGKVAWDQVAGYFILPLAGALVAIKSKVNLSNEAVALSATAISIFAALLFNLILMVVDLTAKTRDRLGNSSDKVKETDLARRLDLLKVLHSNIGFEIVISVFALVALFWYTVSTSGKAPEWLKGTTDAAAFFSFWLLFTFGLHILLILRNAYVLLDREQNG